MENHPSPKWLYAIAFAEGAAVMATEICSAKLLAPYYGSSLYVWSAVMALTLGGLAGGYFLGGFLSQQKKGYRFLSWLLLLAAVYMIALPFLARHLASLAFHAPMLVAVVLSTLILLFPPLVMMGASSPLIIASITSKATLSGQTSGRVYAISTCGGILATFLCGFYLIPEYGLHTALTCFAALLVLGPIRLLYHQSRQIASMLMAILSAMVFYGLVEGPGADRALYYAEGILGQLEVVEGQDSLHPDAEGQPQLVRRLLVNNIVQTEMAVHTGQSVSEYAALVSGKAPAGTGKKALVLGLGGGLIANLLQEKGYTVTGVEWDARISWLAGKYFGLSPGVTIVNDDARHYLNQCSDRYDLILFDVFKAEEQPAHVLTLESCQHLPALLKDSGLVLINWHGYATGHKGLGTAILDNTLRTAGFHTAYAATSGAEDYRNLLVMATLGPRPLVAGIQPNFPHTTRCNTDEHPLFEKYNALANYTWRKHYLPFIYAESH